MIPSRVVTRENQVAREEEPIDASVLSPFPTRQPAAVVEVGTCEQQFVSREINDTKNVSSLRPPLTISRGFAVAACCGSASIDTRKHVSTAEVRHGMLGSVDEG